MDALREQPSRSLTASDLAGVADFQLGQATVSPSRRVVIGPAGTLAVQPRVMQVLVALAQRRGQVVSRETLLDRCWGGVYVGDDSLNRVIAALRKIAADAAPGSFEVETVPRVGYRLIAANEPATAGRRNGARAVFLIGALLAVAAVVAASWNWRRSEPAQPTIAVLPFKALNPGSEAANVAASITDTIGSALAQTGARQPENVHSFDEARKFGAQIVISGTVRRDGTTLRVTAQVDSTRDRSTLLSDQFQAEGDAAPVLGGQVATWLIGPIRMWASFLPIESDRSTTDEILRIFLTREAGNHLRGWELSQSLAAAKPRSGVAQLVQALLTSDVLPKIEPDQRAAAVASAQLAARSAARLLPDPARALAVLDCHLRAPGWLILTPLCDRRTREAVAANPHVPLLPFLFGWQLAWSGRFAEAQKFADMDLAQSPLGPGQLTLRIFATKMAHSGDSDAVLPQLEDRAHRYMGPASLALTDYTVAVTNAHLNQAKALLTPRAASETPHGHPWDGEDGIASGPDRATIEATLRAVRSKSSGDARAMRARCDPPSGALPGDPAFGTCLVGFALLDDKDEVFALARRGYRDVDCCSAEQQDAQWLATGGDYYPRWELYGSALAPVRADRRFIDLARRTGLLAYWKSGHPPDFCSSEAAPVCTVIRERR